MKKRKDHIARAQRIHSNPKIGKLVVNRQHTVFGFLTRNGKISTLISAGNFYVPYKRLGGDQAIRIGQIRVM